jgi:DNA-binding transcriptional LysR family regulator
MDLLALADFNLVARHGGFGKAARAAARPKATLSRRVGELEASLNLRLFERGPRALKLTEEGRALFERSGQLLTELEETVASIASGGRRPRGKLRISAPLLFAQAAMGKIGAAFAMAYPEVRLEVVVEDRAVDMIEEAYDLVIRVNPQPDANLVGRPFLRDQQVVVASPKLARPGPGEPVPALVRGALVEVDTWELTTPQGPVALPVMPVLAMSSNMMLRDAARTGVGIARLPLSLVNRDIQSGQLVQWGELAGADVALWALYPSRRLLSARISAFLTFLKASFPHGTPEELAAFLED